MSAEVSEQDGEWSVGRYLVDNVHGADLSLVEQGVLGFEQKETFELGDDDGFHFHVCEEEERTTKVHGVGCVMGSWDSSVASLTGLQLQGSPSTSCAVDDNGDLRGPKYTGCWMHKIASTFRFIN